MPSKDHGDHKNTLQDTRQKNPCPNSKRERARKQQNSQGTRKNERRSIHTFRLKHAGYAAVHSFAKHEFANKKREPHRTHLRQNTTMKQAQPYKAVRDDKVKAPPSRLTFVTKTGNPHQAQQKSAKIEENTKKPSENRQKYSQMRANNRNKTQQSVKKKAKIAAQQRKKRIKTTTGNTPSTAQFV